MRPLEDWKPPSYNNHRNFHALVRYLIAAYDVPKFMNNAWLEGLTPAGVVHQRWFIHIAQGQNIRQNEANLAGQFATQGLGPSSPFATGMSNYLAQTTTGENALLGQLQQQNILQGQIPVAQGLQAQANQMAQFGQTLMPQYNPMNQYAQQLSTTFAPMYQTMKGGGILGGLSGLLGELGGTIGSSAIEGLQGGGGASDVLSSILGGLAAM